MDRYKQNMKSLIYLLFIDWVRSYTLLHFGHFKSKEVKRDGRNKMDKLAINIIFIETKHKDTKKSEQNLIVSNTFVASGADHVSWCGVFSLLESMSLTWTWPWCRHHTWQICWSINSKVTKYCMNSNIIFAFIFYEIFLVFRFFYFMPGSNASVHDRSQNFQKVPSSLDDFFLFSEG